VDRGRRLGRLDLVRIAADLRQARVGSGLALTTVGDSVGLSASQVSRIERGLAPSATVIQLAGIGAVVGLDVRVRAYPGPDPIRDAAQLRLLGRLRNRLHPRLRMRLEIPVVQGDDRRAWDAWLDGFASAIGPGFTSQAGPRMGDLAVEAETRIADGQAFLRRTALKMRDGGMEAVLIVVMESRANRAAVAAMRLVAPDTFPVSPRRALSALAAGTHPGGSALIFL